MSSMLTAMTVAALAFGVVGLPWAVLAPQGSDRGWGHRRRAARAAGRRAHEAELDFRAAFRDAPIGMALVSLHGTVMAANDVFCRTVGRGVHEVLGQPIGPLAHARDPSEEASLRARTLSGGIDSYRIDTCCILPDGAQVPAVVSVSLVRDDDGTPLHFVWQALDISDRLADQQRLRELADTDSLTGLANRRRFGELLATRGADGGALMVVDLDGFKDVNDALGHAAGDATLRAVATVLGAVMPPGAVLGRLGGDEFGILVPGVDVSEATELGGLAVRALRNRRELGGPSDDQPVVTASVGVTTWSPGRSTSIDDLMAQADLAMYEAKAAGRNRVVAHAGDAGSRDDLTQRRQWLDRLQDPAGHLLAYAQPIRPLGPGGDLIERVELLVRYREDDGNVVGPGVFLPLAERAGLVGGIDRWMLRRAVELVLASTTPLQIAVNVSARTFMDPSFPGFVASVGRALPRGSLMIEITETAALEHTDAVSSAVASLRRSGCLIAIDDFGSGFATFASLSRLDVDVLKIDGTFVSDMGTNDTHRRIVRAIAGLADSLQIPLIAEHVEDAASLEELTAMGVAFGQGYLLGRPQPTATDAVKG